MPSDIDVPEVRTEALSREEIEHRIKTRLGRKIVVVGACTGSDAHTVGIDAILNYKGYAGDKGLESYKGFEAYNLGAQVENDQLAARARALKADAILVSQVITQRNCHKENGRALVELLEQRGLAATTSILLFGGPRVDHQLALELGFDAGFGPGTKPGDVASYLVDTLCGGPRPRRPRSSGAAQAARTTGSRRDGAGRLPMRASIMSSMTSWQEPQSSPAQQAPGDGLDAVALRRRWPLHALLGHGAADADVHPPLPQRIMKTIIKVQRAHRAHDVHQRPASGRDLRSESAAPSSGPRPPA